MSRDALTDVTDDSADVVVIGGGPAGSTAGTLLARKGWKVVLLEREAFPRAHVGESLLPGTMPILEELGVRNAMEEAGFLRKWGATMSWGRDTTPWSWYFKETNAEYPHAYQVFRPEFDKILLNNSEANGVRVHERHRVTEVLFDGECATGVVCVDASGRRRTYRPQFIVDASGQAGLIGRMLGLRREEPSFRNLALYGYYSGVQRLAAPDQNNIFIEATPHGWLWAIPLHNGLTSIGAVVDSSMGGEKIRELGTDQAFVRYLEASTYIAEMLAGASLASGPEVVRDWSYFSDRLTGPGYVIGGDAACFIDPLFSSGVHLAMHSGLLAAAYVTTVLKRPEMVDDAAETYRDLYNQQYDHFRELARLFYASNKTVDSYFWEARRILDDWDSTPREAFIRGVAGQPPKGYERVVLERGDAPDGVLDKVAEMESERVKRRATIDLASQAPSMDKSDLWHAVPHLQSGAAVVRKPLLREGEFHYGYVLVQKGDYAGFPLPQGLADLIEQIDGSRSVEDIVSSIANKFGEAGSVELAPSLFQAMGMLYVDGTIDSLEGLVDY